MEMRREMTNENETVEQVCADIKTRIDELWQQDLGAMMNGEVDDFAERFLAAHTREIAAKDAEMLNLRTSLARVMEVTGDCRMCEECGDETCPWFGEPDGCNNREGRALFLAGKLVNPLKAKDAEISKLRSLVGELADAVQYSNPCADCDVDCMYYGDCKVLNRRSLVTRAREVAKDA